jgi:GTP cyclohydrolase II
LSKLTTLCEISEDGGVCVSDDLFLDAGFTAVQRALGDFQAGNPVVVADRKAARLALSIEALTPHRLENLRDISRETLALAISATKARLPRAVAVDAATIRLKPADTYQDIVNLATGPNAQASRPPSFGDRADVAIIELAKLCHLLPAAITLPLSVPDQFPSALRVTTDEIMGFRTASARSLKLISRAKVALRWGGDSEFIVFRDALGATCLPTRCAPMRCRTPASTRSTPTWRLASKAMSAAMTSPRAC